MIMKKYTPVIFGILLGVFGLVLGCVDPEDESGGGRVGGTSLYVFDSSDSASNRILVYSDLATLFNDPENVQPQRQMRGGTIDLVKNLAWGGMCFDVNGNRLYLVSETGTVVRIERARTQNGSISNINDIASFRLGASDSERLSNGKFGQACIAPSGGSLYVTESNSSDTRVWVISSPGNQADGTSVSNSGYLNVSGDREGTGVTVSTDGSIYAYCNGGSSITNYSTQVSHTGPRLRKGFDLSIPTLSIPKIIISESSSSVNRTMLARYGALAIDNGNSIYLARHLVDAGIGSGNNAILIFKTGQFNSGGWDQPPDKSFAPIDNLRIISHALTKDWLVGALSDGDTGLDSVLMWRAPSLGTEASHEKTRIAGASIRGLALDGKN